MCTPYPSHTVLGNGNCFCGVYKNGVYNKELEDQIIAKAKAMGYPDNPDLYETEFSVEQIIREIV